jgi:hypothetical protein
MANSASGSQSPEDRKPGDEPPDLPEEYLQYRYEPSTSGRVDTEQTTVYSGRSPRRRAALLVLLLLLVLMAIVATGLFALAGPLH